jgi:hypothetical protein
MQVVRFRFQLSADEYQRFYSGRILTAQVRAEDGRTIRFPAGALRKFVTRDGISGRFEIVFDDNNKLVEIRRLEG